MAISTRSGSVAEPLDVSVINPTGTRADGSVTLTLATTAYAVPSSPPASPYLLIISANVTNVDSIWWRLTTGTTLGHPISPGSSMAIKLPASVGLFIYSPTAFQIANFSTAIL